LNDRRRVFKPDEIGPEGPPTVDPTNVSLGPLGRAAR